jgi:uncharacterized coiled-coil DUF342 family protein
MDPRDREIEALERELEDGDLTPSERRDIMRELRDIERDFGDEERWQDEGRDRGWL